MSVIANTTVISNFAAINQIELLHSIFNRISIPTEVYEEIRAGLNEGYQYYETVSQILFPVNESGWLHLTSLTGKNEFRDYASFPSNLHAGETACLAIAKNRKWLFLTDDKAARTIARDLKVRFSGTIGCLRLAVERQHLTIQVANECLRKMIQNGYFSPVNDLRSLEN